MELECTKWTGANSQDEGWQAKLKSVLHLVRLAPQPASLLTLLSFDHRPQMLRDRLAEPCAHCPTENHVRLCAPIAECEREGRPLSIWCSFATEI